MLSDSALHMPLISLEVLQLTCCPLLWEMYPKVQKSANVNFFQLMFLESGAFSFVHKHIIFIDGTVVLGADVHTQVCTLPCCDVAVVEYLV